MTGIVWPLNKFRFQYVLFSCSAASLETMDAATSAKNMLYTENSVVKNENNSSGLDTRSLQTLVADASVACDAGAASPNSCDVPEQSTRLAFDVTVSENNTPRQVTVHCDITTSARGQRVVLSPLSRDATVDASSNSAVTSMVTATLETPGTSKVATSENDYTHVTSSPQDRPAVSVRLRVAGAKDGPKSPEHDVSRTLRSKIIHFIRRVR